MSDPKYRDEDWLREQYRVNERTMRDIADECDTYPSTIKRWLDKYDIQTRDNAGNDNQSVKERFWSKVDKGGEDECWEWEGATFGHGYGHFQFRGKTHPAHRVIWKVKNGTWPAPQCLHKCDNPACVNPNHLYEGDVSDNLQDTWDRNRRDGENTGRPPALFDYEVEDIRQRAEDGERGIQRELADEYCVSEALISKVVNREGAYNE